MTVRRALEMFVNYHLIDHLENARLKLQLPRDTGKVLSFDVPWEGSAVTWRDPQWGKRYQL